MKRGRSERLLVLVLTRRCDQRCANCPQSFEDSDMSEATLDASLKGLLPLLAAPARVKLFGGEPLLRPDLVERALDLLTTLAPGTPVELPTNGRNLPPAAKMLSRRPEVEVFLSRADAKAARLPGVVHNFLIPPGEDPARTARRLMDARRMGFSRFNFLPAYFVRWTPAQLKELTAAFAGLRQVVKSLSRAGRPIEVVNLARVGSTPLYNDGLTVDTDGSVYSSNLILAAAVRPNRADLRLGHARRPKSLAAKPPVDPARVLADSFPAGILADTRRVDAALTAFCRSL